MNFSGLMKRVKNELKQLAHPYYIVNLILCMSFLVLKLTHPLCEWLFPPGPETCELDMRESEILFFLLIVIMIRSRKTGSTTMVSYLSSGFMYAKCANIILYFMSDPRLGLVYTLCFLLQGMLLPEPTYKGPESITYFRGNNMMEEIKMDTKVTWLVAFYAAWSPACINFAHIFSKISNQYSNNYLKFGKLDAGRYPEVAEEFHINTSSMSRQLPTVILFQDGKEIGRVPAIINSKIQKFFFKEEDLVQAFDLNNLYANTKDKKAPVPVEEKKTK
eukprot:TRINITY_DN17586_c0_g1_i4.p1 TRINITY_DN17586_c0_g1~~TRINITY_DN17586_c0_g1_i4.p1  ORF type:complete len:275 (+),score=76.70 TRINITY_DN17586_c0_g1_i4:49-873(+)